MPATKRKSSKSPASATQRKRRITQTRTIGSPYDLTLRKKVNVEDLDLDTSYAEEWILASPKRSRKMRWEWKGDDPLYDHTRLPADWTAREDDLDPMFVFLRIDPFGIDPFAQVTLNQLTRDRDIDSQIERCHESI